MTNEGNVLIKDIPMQGLQLTNGVIYNKNGANFTSENNPPESMRLKTVALFKQDGIMKLND